MAFRTQEEEDALARMTLDEFLIENREATFLFRAAGDSLRDVGILRGDLLLADRSKDPKRGDVVVAVSDGAFSLCRYADIAAAKETLTKVEAVVTAVIRKLT
jgi:SOS-response transcriptional repressor LexA